MKAQGRYFVKSRARGQASRRRKVRAETCYSEITSDFQNRIRYRWSADRMTRIPVCQVQSSRVLIGDTYDSLPFVSNKTVRKFRVSSRLWSDGDQHETTFSVVILPASEGSASRKRRKGALAWLAEVAGYANTCELCNAAERQGEGGVSLVRVSARKAKRHVSKLRRDLLIRGEGIWRIQ